MSKTQHCKSLVNNKQEMATAIALIEMSGNAYACVDTESHSLSRDDWFQNHGWRYPREPHLKWLP